jgi:hypothetical protein
MHTKMLVRRRFQLLESTASSLSSAMEAPRSSRFVDINLRHHTLKEKEGREIVKAQRKALLDQAKAQFAEHFEEPHFLDGYKFAPAPVKVLASQVKYLTRHVPSLEELRTWRQQLEEWQARCKRRGLLPEDTLRMLRDCSPPPAADFSSALSTILDDLEEAAALAVEAEAAVAAQ